MNLRSKITSSYQKHPPNAERQGNLVFRQFGSTASSKNRVEDVEERLCVGRRIARQIPESLPILHKYSRDSEGGAWSP